MMDGWMDGWYRHEEAAERARLHKWFPLNSVLFLLLCLSISYTLDTDATYCCSISHIGHCSQL